MPIVFQSTPSAWRETAPLRSIFPFSKHFNPLPPHGGRLDVRIIGGIVFCISIHSLRMEGDDREISFEMTLKVFQSTPSAWRETRAETTLNLRLSNFNPLPPHGGRLHYYTSYPLPNVHFNPLPPHGGRPGSQYRIFLLP